VFFSSSVSVESPPATPLYNNSFPELLCEDEPVMDNEKLLLNSIKQDQLQDAWKRHNEKIEKKLKLKEKEQEKVFCLCFLCLHLAIAS
jgi:hypothetical protein